MDTQSIETRYAILADDTCCLSCGNAINYSKPQLGDFCVDLGSGRGNDVIRLADKVGKKGFVYGIDISLKMIEKASKLALKLDVKNVKFIRSELEEIPLKTNTIDLIISNCTINHAENKQIVWNEIYRILKNGGRFVISDIYSVQQVPHKYKLDPQAVAECWAGAITKEEYMNIIRTAGFKNITFCEESKPYRKGEIEVVSFTFKGEKE